MASTSQVPRNTVPLAEGSTPVPPRPIKPGGRILPGVGPRPQSLSRAPTTTNPVMVGDPDLIERYPFSGDFFDPRPLPKVRLPKGRMNMGAVYQRFYFDPKSGYIRAGGNISNVTLPKDKLLPPTSNLTKELALTSDTSGVAMHVEKLDAQTLKDIVLAEWKQPAARRVYHIQANLTGSEQYIKFNHDMKANSKRWESWLRLRCNDSNSIANALANLEKKGFIQMTKDPQAATFGSPGPKMPRLKKPIPGEPIKPKPVKGPKVIPKPKPTVTEPKIPGQPPEPKPKPKRKPKPKPKPKPKDPYAQYKYVRSERMTKQIETRIKLETAKIKDAMAAEARALGKEALDSREQAVFLRKYCAQATGEAKLTEKEISKFTKKMTVADKKVLTDTVKGKIEGSWSGVYYGSTTNPQITLMPQRELNELYRDMSSHLSPKVWQHAKKYGLPRVHWVDGLQSGAYYQEANNTIVLPRGTSWNKMQAIFRHEFGHFIDRLGYNNMAIDVARRRWATSGRLTRSKGGWSYLKGLWYDDYMGRVYLYENGARYVNRGEIHSMLNELFAEAPYRFGVRNSKALYALKTQWETNPESIAHWVAWANGAYIP